MHDWICRNCRLPKKSPVRPEVCPVCAATASFEASAGKPPKK